MPYICLCNFRLYLQKSHHQWHLCNINHTEVNLYKYNKDGYISIDCYSKNFKKTNDLKYAIFLTGASDKRLGPPSKCLITVKLL